MNKLPLSGVRVIEICNVAAGPFCGLLLADMGADVIKVEVPNGGDTLRSWPPIKNGFSENFASLNRNKRSITLNLKDITDRSVFLELIDTADVLIENNRPGVMKRLELDYDNLSKISPRLIYCSMSAYGQTGPRSQEGGFDLTIQAMSGIMSVTGEPDAAPMKCGVPLSDFSCGLYAAFSISSALRQVERTGEGCFIDVSMLGSSLGIAALQTSEYFGSGMDPKPMGSAHPRNAPYQIFKSRDGYFGMAAGNNALWKLVCLVLDRLDLYEDERFSTTTLRAKNQRILVEILETYFQKESADYWLSKFQEVGVPCAPINKYSDILKDPQVRFMGWVQPLELPGGVQTKTFASPIRINNKGLPIRSGPPELGQHNDEILSHLKSKITGIK